MKHYRSFMLLILMTVAALAAVACSPAQATNNQSSTNFVVGILNSEAVFQPSVDGFIAGLKEHGYVDGENITYVYGEADSEDDFPAAAKALVEQKVDLIMTVTNGATIAAMEATDTIPVVGGVVAYVVEAGIAESLAKPGRNFTGIDTGPVMPARLALLKEMFPEIKRVYVPLQVGYITSEMSVQAIRPTAEELGIELVVEEIHSREEVEPAIASLPDDVDAVFTVPDYFVSTDLLPNWSQAAIEHGIPLVNSIRAAEGPIFALGPNLYSMGAAAARQADQILDGANAGEIPVENAEMYLAINLKTAHAAGIEIPDRFLSRADEIIRLDDN